MKEWGAKKAVDEWREYDLTPSGWISGSHSFSESKIVIMDRPKSSVLTCVYHEHWGSAYEKKFSTVDVRWSSSDTEKIEKLKKQYGECPKRL